MVWRTNFTCNCCDQSVMNAVTKKSTGSPASYFLGLYQEARLSLFFFNTNYSSTSWLHYFFLQEWQKPGTRLPSVRIMAFGLLCCSRGTKGFKVRLGKRIHDLGLVLKDDFLLGIKFFEGCAVIQQNCRGIFGCILQCAFKAVGILQQ